VDIAVYVRTYRKQLGITQADLAAKLGVARTTIVAIERGQRRLRASELTALKVMGFPDETIDITEPEQSDSRWMWLNRDERMLIRAFRGGRIERVLRMCLAHKDQTISTMQLDEVENGYFLQQRRTNHDRQNG